MPESAHDDGLDVGELRDPHRTQFTFITGGLDAAEGQAGIGGDEGVDEAGAGLQALARDAFTARRIAGEDRRAEAEWRAVGEFDGLVLVARAYHGRHRAEGFLVEGR